MRSLRGWFVATGLAEVAGPKIVKPPLKRRDERLSCVCPRWLKEGTFQ
jgi:hypothetical protein